MSIFRGDASEVYKLAGDLSMVGAKSVPVLREVMAASGEAFAREWAANARETSGEHGKWYPDSIDSEMRPGLHIEVEVGPNAAKPQGRMGPGFEYGSVNQPPHLDGQRATDVVEKSHLKRIDNALGDLGL